MRHADTVPADVRLGVSRMSYLTAHRYGLTKIDPGEDLRASGWRLVWEHPSGLRAVKNPASGRWQIMEYDDVGHRVIRGDGWSSSLRAVAGRIERLVRRRNEEAT